jgi:hypothetical protein
MVIRGTTTPPPPMPNFAYIIPAKDAKPVKIAMKLIPINSEKVGGKKFLCTHI